MRRGGGRPPTITERLVKRVVDMTLRQEPANATHWSTRTMAGTAGVSEASVRRIWRPWTEAASGADFKAQPRSSVPRETGGDRRPVSDSPEHAIVLCADEKSQIQALDRTQPSLPMKKGRCGTMPHVLFLHLSQRE
jgi:DNA-binding MurR/RpiR family transcriptional regulator